jgi:hypothetical protein
MTVLGNVPLMYSASRNEKYGKYATGRGNKDHFLAYDADTKYGTNFSM